MMQRRRRADKRSGFARRRSLAVWRTAIFICALWIFFTPNFRRAKAGEENLFVVRLNGTPVGTLAEAGSARECLRRARKELFAESGEMALMDAELTVSGSSVRFGRIDRAEQVSANMVRVLRENRHETLESAYTVKIREYSVNLAGMEEVMALLDAAIDPYNTAEDYEVRLFPDPERELNVLTATVNKARGDEAEDGWPKAGLAAQLLIREESEEPDEEMEFDDYPLGLQTLSFGDKIEIVPSYLPAEELTPLTEAVGEVTKNQETNQIYEVRAGDTLSTIAQEYGLTVDELVGMNGTLESDASIIRPQDELIVTVPKPLLNVAWTEQTYYEEDYEADVVYIDNDSWYTTKSETVQEPSAGHRRVIAMVSYSNTEEVRREIRREEITYEAVPKIVERGTIVPPTYIKPISGGRLSSGFGRRSAPTKGASSYHRGVDWATPVGTAVMASSGGTVSRAGWGSGYGYVVYIDHPDGRQTRYGHLSKILVKAGDRVNQGQKIALSGNTGVSTGPHVHFEILIGGAQVNPLKYIQ